MTTDPLTPEERRQIAEGLRMSGAAPARYVTLHAAIERILAARAQAAPLTAEAIAGLLAEHQPGDYTHKFFDDPASVCPPVGCRCGWRRERITHEAHQAEVIACAQATAATPADTAPYFCYRCAKGDHDEHTPIAWQPDIQCECPCAVVATRADTASEAKS